MSVTQAALEVLDDYGLAIVTGGSSGIGQCFIATVQEANPQVRIGNLSRSIPPLADVQHFPCDLAARAEREVAFARVAEWVAATPGAGKLLLVNNAGFGVYGRFAETKTSLHVDMIEVNVAALVELTGALLPELRRRGGAVVNVASTAAFQPIPGMQTYAATKAFVLSWSVALAEELGADSGVCVQALCPGSTHTGFQERASLGRRAKSGGFKETPAEVVATCFRALRRGRSIVVSGWGNRVATWAAAHVPRRTAARAAKRVVERNRLPAGE